MSSPFSNRRHSANEAFVDPSGSDLSPVTSPSERFKRLAALIAVGEAPIPSDLEPVDLSFVLAEVARLRRERLVRYVARAIALDFHRTRGS